MQIKKVKLCNFSSYYGETEIDLSTADKKSIILIGGNNGAGKTSLFTAIKLALYGPQCFHFQDKNNQYTAKIKNLINHDAYMENTVHSYVELIVSVPMDRVDSDYCIRREWVYEEKRLSEKYSVLCDGVALSDEDLDFFQNFLFTVIPPNLFEFFFFDGEEVGEFFTTGHYNKYIRNAVLTLCGYDTFNIIRKFCSTYVNTHEEDEGLAETRQEYQQTEKRRTALEIEIAGLNDTILEINGRIENLTNDRIALENQFQKSGGLTETEQEKLRKKMETQDRVKGDKSKRIREFVEVTMPLFIVRDLAEEAFQQMQKESELHSYQAIMEQLSDDVLRKIVSQFEDRDPENLAVALSKGIAQQLKPTFDVENFQSIHDLSKEEENKAISMMVKLQNFDERQMIRACQEKAEAVKKYEDAAQKLRNSLPEIDANTYIAKMAQLTQDIQQYSDTLHECTIRLSKAEEELEQTAKQEENLRKEMQVKSKNRAAYTFTGRMTQVMDAMIRDVTHEKFKEVQKLTIDMFKRIIRKSDYVELIELDDKFNINLFKKQTYTVEELAYLLRNIGIDELEYRLGTTGMELAMKEFGCVSSRELRSYLLKNVTISQIGIMDQKKLRLYKRMEMNQLSKGEKQVFVLALYWAIIKAAGQKVPFIIDTPFARIDTEHREQITKSFFTTISDQVIILSTDEEVVGSYYKMLAPNLAHEYLLDYEQKTGRTAVKNGYFAR